MQQLHYFPGNASLAVHVVLEEIGSPFELVLVDRHAGGHKTPQYLQLNPNGLIPVFVDGDLVRQNDAVVVFELIPVDVEEVSVQVLARLPGDPRHGDEPHGRSHLLGRDAEPVRNVVDGDIVVVDQVRHEREQEGELLRSRTRGAGVHALSLCASRTVWSLVRTAARSSGGESTVASGPNPASSSARMLRSV